MIRSSLSMASLVEWHPLITAFGNAAQGKQGRPDVEAYRAVLDGELRELRLGMIEGTVAVGKMRRFSIRDPKPRDIHAPVFRERVLHHALMAGVGPVLDRSLVDDVFACRTGKGALAAVKRAQHHSQRSEWYAQIDIRHYFAHISHDLLLEKIGRKFRSRDISALIGRIVRAYEDHRGHGLPIGALTSQIFANFFLSSADRLVQETSRAKGYVRYMDDLVWWGPDRASVRQALGTVRDHLETELGLTVKDPVRIGQCRDGMTFCGYRIFPDRLLLTRRKKARFAMARRKAEHAFLDGKIEEIELQRRLDAALSITRHCDSLAWRREQLRRHPVAPELQGI